MVSCIKNSLLKANPLVVLATKIFTESSFNGKDMTLLNLLVIKALSSRKKKKTFKSKDHPFYKKFFLLIEPELSLKIFNFEPNKYS